LRSIFLTDTLQNDSAPPRLRGENFSSTQAPEKKKPGGTFAPGFFTKPFLLYEDKFQLTKLVPKTAQASRSIKLFDNLEKKSPATNKKPRRIFLLDRANKKQTL